MRRRPSTAVLDDLSVALEQDDTRLGDVYRGKRDGLTNAQIAHSVGAASHGWITNYNGIIDSLQTAKVPDGAVSRRNMRSAVVSFRERHRGSLRDETLSWLDAVVAGLSRAGETRPEHNDRDWVSGEHGAADHFQTIQLDAEVYRLLEDRRLPADRTINDTLRRLLS